MSEVQDTQFNTAQQLINTVNQKIENRDSLTMDELKMICPEIATPEINPALRQKLGITDRYVHVPTEKVIEDVMKLGWTPINAYRVNSRKKRSGTGRHMVKFVNYDFMEEGKTEYPELLLTNSHDGTTAFKLDVGIFRLVCSNGMVVKSQDFGSMKVRHYGYDFETIKGAVNELVEQIPDYLILSSTRKEDDGDGLWEVFNRIQEKVVNGKFNYALGKKERKARPVKGFKSQVKLNQGLWELASSYLSETAAA